MVNDDARPVRSGHDNRSADREAIASWWADEQAKAADADVAVVPMDDAAAAKLDKRIRTLAGAIDGQLEKLADLVAEARDGHIHIALGYASWTAYLADALATQITVKRGERRELVQFLAGEGMSQRAISTATGFGKTTVQRELSGGPKGPPEAEGKVLNVVVTKKDQPPPTVLNLVVTDRDQKPPQSICVASRTPADDRVDLDAKGSTTTGMDNKKYPRPAPKPPRVKTFPEVVEAATWTLQKDIAELEELLRRPEFGSQRNHLPVEHLRALRDRLTAAIDMVRAD